MPEAKHVNLSELVSASVSTDGTTAAIIAKQKDGSEVVITFDAMQIRDIDVAVQLLKRNVNGGEPQTVEVCLADSFSMGDSPEHPDRIVLGFNHGQPSETIVLLKDGAAWNVAEHIKTAVVKRANGRRGKTNLITTGKLN